MPFTFIALNGRSMHARRALSGNAGDRMIIYILMLKLLQLSSADSRCEHDSISIVQYTEAITALEYDEAQANGQGAVISQVMTAVILIRQLSNGPDVEMNSHFAPGTSFCTWKCRLCHVILGH